MKQTKKMKTEKGRGKEKRDRRRRKICEKNLKACKRITKDRKESKKGNENERIKKWI